jgi:hypothetical protein
MTKQDIHSVVGDEGTALAGASAPSSHSGRRTQPVILVHHRPQTAASVGLGDAIEPEGESFSSLGSIAVRLVARWTLPRMQMSLEPARERSDGPQLPVNAREEDR